MASFRLGQTRTGTRLLKTVGGQPHATREDHELGPREHLNAEPASSDQEHLRPPPRRPKPPPQPVESTDTDPLRQPPGSSRKRRAGPPLPDREPEPGLKLPGAGHKPRPTAPRVPRRGQFEQGRAAKGRLDVETEYPTATRTPPTSSQGNDWGFNPLLVDSSQGSQKAKKKDYGSKARADQFTSNIHAARPTARKQGKCVKYGARPKKQDTTVEDNDDDSDTSMLIEYNDEQLTKMGLLADMPEPEPEDPELRKVPKRQKKAAQTNGDAADLREQLGLTENSYPSLPPSSAPQEDMDNIDLYVRKLPTEPDEDTACPICHEPVSQESYWRFWEGLSRTVKNQATFCHTHRRASALAEYASEGFPPIDWPKLPERIKKHRMALYSILAGESPSAYRARYEPLALTGKAAAVPSIRSDLSPSKQRDLAALALDDNAVYPGYYGPRGRRAITECVMALLHAEIKRSIDPVVQISGPATFVQAVLVPEVAVRLIMEDVQCDRDTAEEVRERTFDMGVLVNEEIEDEVLVGDAEEDEEQQEDGENEYHL